MTTSRFSRWFFLFGAAVAAFVVVLFSARAARAGEPLPLHTTVDLYTIGPASEFPSRFGHSLLCAHEAGKDDVDEGRCYDYGVPDREDIAHVLWTSVREVPAFIPVAIEEKNVIRFFRKQGRAIERQRLPLSAEEATTLVTALEKDVSEHRAYAYHPYWANCATKLRDQIDVATHGRLQKGPANPPPGNFREYMEIGHGGNLDILTAMALYLGEGNDVEPSPYQSMLLPTVLRDGVADQMSAIPEKVDDAVDPYQPGNPAVGRIAVFSLAVVLVAIIRFTGRRRLRLGLKIVGGFLGAFAISIELVASLVKWNEISHNWSLGLFLPTDLLLPWLSGRKLALYVKLRLVMALVFAILEIANVIHQPILPLVALVALPMIGILSALRDGAQMTTTTTTKAKAKSDEALTSTTSSRAA